MLTTGGPSTFRLPRVIEHAADLDILEARKHMSVPQKRLSLEMRFAVRIGLPIGISVLKLNASSDDIAVRITLHDV